MTGPNEERSLSWPGPPVVQSHEHPCSSLPTKSPRRQTLTVGVASFGAEPRAQRAVQHKSERHSPGCARLSPAPALLGQRRVGLWPRPPHLSLQVAFQGAPLPLPTPPPKLLCSERPKLLRHLGSPGWSSVLSGLSHFLAHLSLEDGVFMQPRAQYPRGLPVKGWQGGGMNEWANE